MMMSDGVSSSHLAPKPMMVSRHTPSATREIQRGKGLLMAAAALAGGLAAGLAVCGPGLVVFFVFLATMG